MEVLKTNEGQEKLKPELAALRRFSGIMETMDMDEKLRRWVGRNSAKFLLRESNIFRRNKTELSVVPPIQSWRGIFGDLSLSNGTLKSRYY